MWVEKKCHVIKMEKMFSCEKNVLIPEKLGIKLEHSIGQGWRIMEKIRLDRLENHEEDSIGSNTSREENPSSEHGCDAWDLFVAIEVSLTRTEGFELISNTSIDKSEHGEKIH